MPTFASLGVPADLVDTLSTRAASIRPSPSRPPPSPTPSPAATSAAGPPRARARPSPSASRSWPTSSGPPQAGPARSSSSRPVSSPPRSRATSRGSAARAAAGSLPSTAASASDGQLKALRRGVDVAVACPGRLADLVSRGDFRLDGVELVVVDEADRMADMGFLPEVERMLDQTSDERQTLLFSATLDGDVDVLVRRYQHDPARHDVTPTSPTAASSATTFGWSTGPTASTCPRRSSRAAVPPSCSPAPATAPTASAKQLEQRRPRAPPPSTVTAARASATGPWPRSPSGKSPRWSPPTSPPAASTSTTWPA